jgi:hypothetical protein
MDRYKIQFLIIKHKHAKEFQVVHKYGILKISKEEESFLREILLGHLNLSSHYAENLLTPMMILINKKMRVY